MITVNGFEIKKNETLTIFPDNTSQIWKLPDSITKSKSCVINWWFEEEREIIDLLSLRKLLQHQDWLLNIPYFPYARQDKNVDNQATFNRVVIIDLLTKLNCRLITSFDIHSVCEMYPFMNREVSDFHAWVLEEFQPHFIVSPDLGAFNRYPYLGSYRRINFEFEKARDQKSGQLTSHQLVKDVLMPDGRYLIVDDLCDGGATFLSIAEIIKEKVPNAEIGLAVTHGIFSRGRDILREKMKLFYTNTLLSNHDGLEDELFEVC